MHWWEHLEEPLLGRYRIERLLGEGGMARVFLATDLRANRPVAFKTPKLESFPPDRMQELLARFRREFKAQAEDPIHGVIPVYEAGEFSDRDGVQRPFLVMQYLGGGSLGGRLGGSVGARARRQVLSEVLDWLAPIARTIDRLHARGFLHRDIKPDNILFNGDDDAFLADFGVVGVLDPGNALSGSTLGPSALGSPGSPGYQSPESIKADSLARMASASDQFSLAITVYEALAGVLPVQVGSHAEWYAALVNWRPTPLSEHLPDIPRAAEAAVMKAMSAQAQDRFLSCSAFAQALAEAVREARATPASAPGLPEGMSGSTPAGVMAVDDAAEPEDKGRSRIGWLVAAALVAVGVLAYELKPLMFPDPLPTAGQIGRAPDPAVSTTQAQAQAEPAHEGTTLASGDPVDQLISDGIAATRTPTCESPDSDQDGTNDCEDLCPQTSAVGNDNRFGCRLRRDVGTAIVKYGFETYVIRDTVGMLALDQAIAKLQGDPNLKYVVLGGSNTLEEGAAGLSLRRARGVYDYLVAKGVDRARLLGPLGDTPLTVSSGAEREMMRQVELIPVQ